MENQEVISVIYCQNGVIDHIKSFIINDPTNENKRNEKIAECEQYFIDLIAEHNNDNDQEIDFDYYLDQGGYSNDSGVDLYISWSI